MLTREEILTIENYSEEHKMTHKAILAELNIHLGTSIIQERDSKSMTHKLTILVSLFN